MHYSSSFCSPLFAYVRNGLEKKIRRPPTFWPPLLLFGELNLNEDGDPRFPPQKKEIYCPRSGSMPLSAPTSLLRSPRDNYYSRKWKGREVKGCSPFFVRGHMFSESFVFPELLSRSLLFSRHFFCGESQSFSKKKVWDLLPFFAAFDRFFIAACTVYITKT